MNLVIKWNGKEYLLEDISEQMTVLRLKEIIYEKTKVNPIHQKLLGINFKGKSLTDDIKLCLLSLKPGMKIMMMGTQEDILSNIISPPVEVTETTVIDDFDIEEEEVLVQNREEHLAKIQKRIDTYKVNEINPPRPGKRLLVLDIDYTIFDHRSSAENGFQLMRPYLHEFLAAVYPWYDIVIWSATGMKWIKAKMEELGMLNHDNFKLTFFMDSGAMITIHTEKYGLIETKPLGVIWGIYPQYSCKNTIMFDDLRRNFLMNPSSGLKIRPFQNAHQNRGTDRELLHLSNYLLQILDVDDFTTLRHGKWESLVNMYKELSNDIPGFKTPNHGFLLGWAKQGVLMLNAVLTVEKGAANSHKDKGWEKFTDAIIHWINLNLKGVVFILWGGYAQKKGSFIDKSSHLVLTGMHPSPLSAHRGFFGCKHFSRANQYLRENNKQEIDWCCLPLK